jgi:hypothetical protein
MEYEKVANAVPELDLKFTQKFEKLGLEEKIQRISKNFNTQIEQTSQKNF